MRTTRQIFTTKLHTVRRVAPQHRDHGLYRWTGEGSPETVVLEHVFLQHLVQRTFGHFAFSLLFAQHLKELGVVLLLKLTFRLHREIKLQRRSDPSRRYSDNVVPRTYKRLADSSFSVAGPTAWNSLPVEFRRRSTYRAFCSRLKIFLFSKFYSQ